MLALHVLQERERLTQGTQRILDARLPVDLRRGKLRLEKRADGAGDVLCDYQDLLRDLLILL